jgi:hypothetical protein
VTTARMSRSFSARLRIYTARIEFYNPILAWESYNLAQTYEQALDRKPCETKLMHDIDMSRGSW